VSQVELQAGGGGKKRSSNGQVWPMPAAGGKNFGIFFFRRTIIPRDLVLSRLPIAQNEEGIEIYPMEHINLAHEHLPNSQEACMHLAQTLRGRPSLRR